MKYILVLVLFINLRAMSQDQIDRMQDSVIKIGKSLYRSEIASWYGTDIFLERFKQWKQNVGGYFSYSDNNLTNCVFFDKEHDPQVLPTITFDSTYRTENAHIDSNERSFTAVERDIYTVRQIAVKEIMDDTLFKSYSNTRLNIIPLLSNGRKEVYVLTGPQNEGTVIIGNDYLISFDDANRIIGARHLHKNIILIDYGKDSTGTGYTMHSHLSETGDCITATDICTLMLYEHIAKWKQHIVLSKNYASIWDCSKNQLIMLTREAWKRIYKDQQEKH